MSQPLVLVLIAILGITGTLGGVWLGSRLTQRNEDRKWRREHALEAYSNFLRLVDATVEESTHAYHAECESESYKRHGTAVVEKLSELYRTSDRILLLSKNEMQAPFSDLGRYVPEVAQVLTKCPKNPETEIKSARSKLSELMARFVMAARNDLGVHPRNQLWNEKPKWWRFWR
jgi:hypothetical protein